MTNSPPTSVVGFRYHQPMLKSDNIYNYTGGNRKIENYSPNEKVKLLSNFTGIGIEGNNFLIKSSTGALMLENVRDKLIDVAGGDGQDAFYYKAGTDLVKNYESGELLTFAASYTGWTTDGRGLGAFEVIIGADNRNNQIFTSENGSTIRGGANSNDKLYGNKTWSAK